MRNTLTNWLIERTKFMLAEAASKTVHENGESDRKRKKSM